MNAELPTSARAAKEAGLAFYFTGVACARGHLASRFAASHDCVECNRLRGAKRYEVNRDAERARVKAYRASNVEWDTARKARQYRENKAERIAAHKRWREQNKAHVAAYAAARQRANPEAGRAASHNRRARMAAAEGKHTASDIKRIFAAQKGKCASCAVKLKRYHVDHIVPLALGGGNGPRNLQILCAPCNLQKGAKHPVEWASSRGLLV